MGVKKELIYPFLLKCCDIPSEQFWKNIFEDLAYGQAPYGAFISKGFLTCTYKGKAFSYKLVESNPSALYRDIYELFTQKLGIFSASEHNRQKLIFEQMEQSIRERREDWSKIRKKNVKDLIIESYVVDMKKQHNLSYVQARKLAAIIYLALQFKTVTNKDINYSAGEIVSIDGISFRDRQIVLNKGVLILR